MKIALIEFTGRPAMEYYCTMIANALQDQPSINEITLLVNSDFNRPDILHSDIVVEYFEFPQSTAASMFCGLSPKFTFLFLEKLMELDIDITHFLSEIRTPYPVVRAVTKRYPTAITVHEPDAYVPNWLRKLILNPIQNYNTILSASASDLVFVHGENSKNILIDKNVKKEKISTYPHGSFAPFYKRHDYESHDTEKPIILYFGRIFPGKGVEFFLSAARRVESSGTDATFVLAGSGDLDRYWDQIAAIDNLEIQNEFIDESEAAALFDRADIVVLPYEDGSQSGIIGIAAGFNTPVVATNVGNFSEMVLDQQSGLLVPSKDEKALTSAILKLIENPSACRKMGKYADQIYKNQLSWEQASNRIIDQYAQIL